MSVQHAGVVGVVNGNRPQPRIEIQPPSRQPGRRHLSGASHWRPYACACGWSLLAALTLLHLLAAPALAAEGGSPSLGGAAVRSVASLALVVALILAASVVARRWLGRVPAGGHRNPIQIVASRALGSRATITMLEVEGERLLVASSPHGLGLICKLRAADPEEAGDGRFDRLLADESMRGTR